MNSFNSLVKTLISILPLLILSGCGIQKFFPGNEETRAEKIIQERFLEIKSCSDEFSVSFAERSLRLLEITSRYPMVSVLDLNPRVVIDTDGQARTKAEISARKPVLRDIEKLKKKFGEQMGKIKSQIRKQLVEKGISPKAANKAWNKVIYGKLAIGRDPTWFEIVGKLYG